MIPHALFVVWMIAFAPVPAASKAETLSMRARADEVEVTGMNWWATAATARYDAEAGLLVLKGSPGKPVRYTRVGKGGTQTRGTGGVVTYSTKTGAMAVSVSE